MCATKCNEELALGAQFSEPEPGLGLIFCMLLLPLWRTSPGKTIPESFPMATAGTAVSLKLPDRNFLPRAADCLNKRGDHCHKAPPPGEACGADFWHEKFKFSGSHFGAHFWYPILGTAIYFVSMVPILGTKNGPQNGYRKNGKKRAQKRKKMEKKRGQAQKKLDLEAEEIVLKWVPTRGVM